MCQNIAKSKVVKDFDTSYGVNGAWFVTEVCNTITEATTQDIVRDSMYPLLARYAELLHEVVERGTADAEIHRGLCDIAPVTVKRPLD